MPAFKTPLDGNVALDPRPASHRQQDPLLFRPHVYFALAVLAVVLVAHFAFRRLANSSCLWFGRPAQFRPRQPGSSKDPGSCERDCTPPARPTTINRPPSSPLLPQGFEKEPQTLWGAALLRTPASPVGIDFSATPGMGTHLKDRSGSRGVSSSAADLTQPTPLSARGPRLGRRSSRSPSRIHITNPDGPANWEDSAMTDHSWQPVPQTVAGRASGEPEQHVTGGNSAVVPEAGGSSLDLGHSTPRQFCWPPPPPPLTPPALSTAMFTFEDRQPGYAVSIPPQLDATFIHQPNPDYLASSTPAELSSSPKTVTTTPRRWSYNKTVPIGIPSPDGPTSSPRSLHSSASSEAFSPSSYPPSSPRLPPPPPSHFDDFNYEHDGQPQEIGLRGEIVSVMNDAGHGWKRHTRVYGGGVCLACMASGGQGGFYGDKVPPEDRR